MRPRLIGPILGLGLMLTGCSGDNGTRPMASAGSDPASGASTLEKVAANLGPLFGATGDFTAQVFARGCSNNPFVGKSPIEVLALTSIYTGYATTGYADGIGRAEAALAMQLREKAALIVDLDAAMGGLGLGVAFSSFNMIEANGEAATALVREVETRVASRPLPEPVIEELRQANRSLFIGNHFQVDAAVGAVLLAAYIAEDVKRGGTSRLARIVHQELDRVGGTALVDELTTSPETLMGLVMNLADAYTLHRTLNAVTDFGEEQRAAALLDLAVDFRTMQEAAQAQANSLRGRYPEELGYRPTGEIIHTLLSDALTDPGVKGLGARAALSTAMSICGGTFGGTTMRADGGPPTPSKPAPPEQTPMGEAAQQFLGGLGGLAGQIGGRLIGPGATNPALAQP